MGPYKELTIARGRGDSIMFSYHEFLKNELTKKIEELEESFIGQTIEDVDIIRTGKETEVEEIVLTFVDGTRIKIYAGSEKGCKKCDSDGALSDYVGFEIYPNKKGKRKD
jgi:hypothetical protein